MPAEAPPDWDAFSPKDRAELARFLSEKYPPVFKRFGEQLGQEESGGMRHDERTTWDQDETVEIEDLRDQ